MTTLINPILSQPPLRRRPQFEELIGVYDKDFALRGLKKHPFTDLAESHAYQNLAGQLDAIKVAQERKHFQDGLLLSIQGIAAEFGVSVKELQAMKDSLAKGREDSDRMDIRSDEDDDDASPPPPRGGGGKQKFAEK